jgi:hypothetical protein
MKKYFVVISFLFSIHSIGQTDSVLKNLKIDSNAKLIGHYARFDKNKTYREYNFILKDSIEIKKLIYDLTSGDKRNDAVMRPSFFISLIQNHKVSKTWILSPTTNCIFFNENNYEFDISRLQKISKNHPFDYTVEEVAFKQKNDYIKYLNKQKKDKQFLYNYIPEFKYEGSFEIEFPKNEIYSSPKAIFDYLNPIIEKISKKEEYRLGYLLNEKNSINRDQYTITIEGSKKLFNTLKLENLKAENWKKITEYGTFFYIKK